MGSVPSVSQFQGNGTLVAGDREPFVTLHVFLGVDWIFLGKNLMPGIVSCR